MKTAKFTLMFLACTAAVPAFAQNTPDSNCGITNYDRARNTFTIVNPTPGTANQQCFITVVAKDSWPGGVPDLTASQLVEGNYEVTLSGGGGGGGSGATRGGGGGGAGAIPFTTVRYLKPGVYRLTIGAGGRGAPSGGNAEHGAPTSLSDAYSGETVAGYTRAEFWDGTYPWNYADGSSSRRGSNQLTGFAGTQSDSRADGSGGQGLDGQASGGNGGRINIDPRGEDGGRPMNVAYSGTPGKGGNNLAGGNEVAGGGGGGAGYGNGGNGGSAAVDGRMTTGAISGELGGGGGGGAGGEGVSNPGAQGGNGFIKLAFAGPVPQAAAAPVTAAPAASSDTAATPAPEAFRPARRDRN